MNSDIFVKTNRVMAKPLKSLLLKLADKAGLDPANAQFLDLLSKIDSSADDTVYDSLDKFLNGAMTLDVAKVHPDVVKHYNATIFNGMDAKIKALATEYGLDPTEMAEIDTEKNTYEKYKILNKIAVGKIEKKYEGQKGDGKEEMLKQIKQLNADIVAERESSQKAINAAKEQAEVSVLDYAFDSYLGSKKYANEEIPAEVNIMTAKNLTQSELQKLGAKLIRKDGKLALVNATNPELPFIKDNKEVAFNDFTDTLLGNNKLLKVSDANPNPNPAPRKNIQNPDGKQPDTSKITSAIDAQLASFGAGVN